MSHAPFAPSQAHRWTACPSGQAFLLANTDLVPADQSSVYADEGTAAHALLEKALREDMQPWHYKGHAIRVLDEGVKFVPYRPGSLEDRTFEINDDMIDAVGQAVEYVKRREQEMPDADVSLERHSRMYDHRHDVGGTADIVIDLPFDTLEVADYKHGKGILVDVEDNPQLLMYLYGIAKESGFTHERYRYTIIQPRHPHYTGPIWMEITQAQILAFGSEIKDAVDQIDYLVTQNRPLVDLELNAGDHCRFCPLKVVCPEIQKKAAEIAQIDFSDTPDAPSADVDYANVLAWAPVIEDWLKAVKGSAEAKMLAGQEIEGWKVVRRRSNRRWREDLSAVEIERGACEHGVSASDLYDQPKMRSVAQVEKMIPKDRRQAFNEALAFKAEGGLTIAPVSDRRKAVEPVGDEFPDDV